MMSATDRTTEYDEPVEYIRTSWAEGFFLSLCFCLMVGIPALLESLGAWLLRDTKAQRRGLAIVLGALAAAGIISQVVMYVERAGR